LRDSLNVELGVLAEMRPSSGGVFEVTVNGDVIFSKKRLDRFPKDNEINELVERFGLI
tara:strand:+ start:948 stop:1121 length:174 start_codon:yes stop_codon:yes gene_type:complete